MRYEPDAPELMTLIGASASSLATSAVSVVEAGLILEPSEFILFRQRLLRHFGIVVVPFDESFAEIAVDAAQRFGKGRGTKAQLNFGDCCSYATAKALRMPLLFKGSDFLHTDIEPARPMQR